MHWIAWIDYLSDVLKICAVPAGIFELLPEETRERATDRAFAFISSKRWKVTLIGSIVFSLLLAVFLEYSFYVIPIAYAVCSFFLFFWVLGGQLSDQMIEAFKSEPSGKREEARAAIVRKFCFAALFLVPWVIFWGLTLVIDSGPKEMAELLFTPYERFTEWTQTERFWMFDYLFPDIHLNQGLLQLATIQQWLSKLPEIQFGMFIGRSPGIILAITILSVQLALLLYAGSVFVTVVLLIYVGLMKFSTVLKQRFHLEGRSIPLAAFVIFSCGEITSFVLSTIKFMGYLN